MELDKYQEFSVNHQDSLVTSAYGGAGKTLCIINKVINLINDGVPPSKIVVCTFTKKVTDELKKRIAESVGIEDAKRIRIGTLHSLCYEIYRRNMKSMDEYFQTPQVIKDGFKYIQVSIIINRLKLKSLTSPIPFLEQLDKWRNEGLSADDVYKTNKYICDTADVTYNKLAASVTCYKEYERFLKSNNMIDFGAMLTWTYKLLKDESILKREARKVEYLLIDEGQDLNSMQYKLLTMLSSTHKKQFLYLDQNQAIYSFMGARHSTFKNFINDNAIASYNMPNNYRSKKGIVELGNKLIKKANPDCDIQTAIPIKQEYGNIKVINNPDEYFEAHELFEFIIEKLNNGYQYKDITILYRVNAQSRALVDKALENDIPYRIAAKDSFYSRKEVTDIVRYMYLLLDPNRLTAKGFKTICNRPNRYIATASINKIDEYAINNNITFYSALDSLYDIDINPNQLSNISKFVDDMEHYQAYCEGKTSTYMLDTILTDIGYKDYIKSSSKDSMESITEDTINSLFAFTEKYKNPIKLLNFFKSVGKNNEKEEENSILFSSIHGFKGLESPIICIAGVSETILPHRKSLEVIDDINEERRVMYVAVTRAIDELLISTIDGKYGRFKVKPSRFLQEMELIIPTLVHH